MASVVLPLIFSFPPFGYKPEVLLHWVNVISCFLLLLGFIRPVDWFDVFDGFTWGNPPLLGNLVLNVELGELLICGVAPVNWKKKNYGDIVLRVGYQYHDLLWYFIFIRQCPYVIDGNISSEVWPMLQRTCVLKPK